MKWLPRFPKFVGLAPSSIDKDPSSKWSPRLGSLQLGCISHQRLKRETRPNIFNFSEDFQFFWRKMALKTFGNGFCFFIGPTVNTPYAWVTSDAFTAPTRRNRHDSRQKQCYYSGWAHDDYSSRTCYGKGGKSGEICNLKNIQGGKFHMQEKSFNSPTSHRRSFAVDHYLEQQVLFHFNCREARSTRRASGWFERVRFDKRNVRRRKKHQTKRVRHNTVQKNHFFQTFFWRFLTFFSLQKSAA